MNGHFSWWKRLAVERPQCAKRITPSEMQELKAMVEADPLGEWVKLKEGGATITFLEPEATRAWRERHASGT